jgi:hypothetical protein
MVRPTPGSAGIVTEPSVWCDGWPSRENRLGENRRLGATSMQTGTTVQVAGSLNISPLRWAFNVGITLCVLAPISYGLQQAGWRGLGRLRGIIMLLKFIGPVWLLVGGAASLLFAMAIRQAQMARRRDLEIGEGGFALIDRQGRREFLDNDVLSMGFRSRSAAEGTVATQHGWATLMVEGRDGLEWIKLEWEYPDGSENPLQDWLGRLLDRLLDRAVATIDKGGTFAGEGWELSRSGLLVGDSIEVIPFENMTLAEYHDGELRIWTKGHVEPTVRIEEGSKDEAILYAIVNERMPATPASGVVDGPAGQGLGRMLFERHWSFLDRFALWLLCSILAAPFLVATGFIVSRFRPTSFLAVVPASIALLAYLPAWARQVSVFRFHEGGVSRKGMLGLSELPFEDLLEVKVKTEDTYLKIRFKPIKGRGRKTVSLFTRSTDEALETIRLYVPGAVPID